MNQIVTKFRGDRIIWAVLILLCLISLPVIYSASSKLAYRQADGNTLYYVIKQAIMLTGGLFVAYFLHRLPYTLFKRYAKLVMFIGILFLVLTALAGSSTNGATRWFLGIQPSDIAKYGLILYISKLLSQYQDDPEKLKATFWEILIYSGLIIGLILVNNLSTALLLGATVVIMLFIGRYEIKQLFRFVGICVGGALIMGFILMNIPGSRFETWKNRIITYVENKDDGKSSSGEFQSDQAKIAIATGGLIGKFPGNSTQKNILPEPHSDFVYAVIIEEMGSVTGITLLLAYLALFYRAGMLVKKTNRVFPALIVIGFTINMIFQAFAHMMVNVGLIPVTGQPLPWVSMGGTSIIMTGIGIGAILSVSRSIENGEFENQDEANPDSEEINLSVSK